MNFRNKKMGNVLQKGCRGGEKNVLAFPIKRKDVLIKTQVHLK